MIFTLFRVITVLASLLLASPECLLAAPAPAEALRGALAAYTPAQGKAGKQAAADAFFLFEGSELDRDLGARNPTLYREIEGEWARLLTEMGDGRPAAEVRAKGEHVLALLDRGARAAEGAGGVFLDSLLIILREGFEAILIVSALAAYLSRIGQRAQRPYLYGGAGLAVVASVLLWMAARSVLTLGGAGREALEGWTILLATAVLFWVSYWLISKAEADRWQAFVRTRVERAVGRGALFGFGFLSFVVVFREGFETVLFYEAVAARAGSSASGQSLMVAGFASGCAALTILYLLFEKIGPKIPMRAFFNVTSALLYFMAFRFAGAGVRELQDAGVVSQTPVSFVPDSAWLAQWLGMSPFLEPLMLQMLLLLLAAFAAGYQLRGRGRVDPNSSHAPARRRAAAS